MKRYVLVAFVAVTALVLAAPAAGSTNIHSPKAHIAKKCKKKKHKKCKKHQPAPVVVAPPAPPAPLPLSEAEVKNAVNVAAYNYCLPDAFCYDYGIYVDSAGNSFCSARSTYEWSCYGWNSEDDGMSLYTCDFRQIVDRSGYSSLTSRQDLSFGSSGWDCN